MKYLSKVVKNDRSRRRSGGGGRENGFSLIELMIAASILIVVVLFAVKMFNFYMSGSRLRTEKNQIDREKDSLGILLRPDFENAGFNLISRQNHVYGTQPAAFASDTRYQAIGNGEIVRLAPGGATAGDYINSETGIGSETGSVTATFGGEAGIKLSGETGEYLLLAVVRNISDGRLYLRLHVSGTEQSLIEHLAGTTYRISLIPDVTGKAALITRIGATEAENVQLTRRSAGLPVGAIAIAAYIANTDDRLRAVVKGAPLTDRGATRTLRNALFVDLQTGAEVMKSIFTTPDGNTTLISGALDSRIGYIQDAAEDFTQPKDIIAANDFTGSEILSGDYCVLLDYESGNSALLQISAAINDNAGHKIYTVNPVRAENAAWSRFYSTEASLQSRFGRGSRLVKLAPPITYRLSEDRRLIRQVGVRAETIAFEMETFDVREVAGGSTYQIDLTIRSDASAAGSQGPRTRYSFSAQPRTGNAGNESE